MRQESHKLTQRIESIELDINEKMDKKFEKESDHAINELEELDCKNEIWAMTFSDIRVENKNTHQEALNLINSRSLEVLHEAKGKIADTSHSCDGRIRFLGGQSQH